MSTNNEAYVSKPPLELGINPSILASTAPTPLGILSVLPLELRNEIYRHLFNHNYYFYCQSASRNGSRMKNVKLPMKTISKRVREEFLAVLHAEAVFIIHDDSSSMGERTRDKISFIDQIQNLKYKTQVYLRSDKDTVGRLLDLHQANKALTGNTAEPLSFFTGTQVSRKICTIDLRRMTAKALLILESPFMDAIKGLTGFGTVVLNLSMDETGWCAEDALAYIPGDPSNANHVVGFRAIVEAMRSALEPSLGPSVISKVDQDPGWSHWLAWKITFHPRDYTEKKKDPKAISGTRGDEGNESQPQVGSS